MNPGTLGQTTTMLILTAIAVYLIYCFGKALLANRKLDRILETWAKERDHGRALEQDWNFERDRRIQRQRRLLAVADAVVEQENEWQANARKAEALGFRDDDDDPRMSA